MQQYRLGVLGSQFAEKDPWVLVDNLNTRQQCALAVKKANGIMRCFSKRSRDQQSQGILHLYSALVGLCLSTVSSYRLPPYKNNADLLEGVYSEGLWDGQGLVRDHGAHQQAVRDGHLQLGEEKAGGRPFCCLQLPGCRTGLEDGTSPFSEGHSDGNRHKLQQGKFRIQGKGEKIPIPSGWPNTGIGYPEKLENLQSL